MMITGMPRANIDTNILLPKLGKSACVELSLGKTAEDEVE